MVQKKIGSFIAARRKDNVIQRDINGIALALREAHKDDFFSVPEDNPLKELLETAGEIASPNSDTEQAYLAFICKLLKL